MFEQSFSERIRNRKKCLKNDSFLEVRDMYRERAYTDCRHTFYVLADRTEDYASYSRPHLYALTAVLFAAMAAILAVLLAKDQTTVAKVFIGLFMFSLVIVLSFIIREAILDSIAQDIAKCFERIDAHELVRPRMVAKLRKEFEDSRVDPDFLKEPDYEALEDDEEDNEGIFGDDDEGDGEAEVRVAIQVDGTDEASDEGEEPEPEKATDEGKEPESEKEHTVGSDSIEKLLHDIDAFLEDVKN